MRIISKFQDYYDIGLSYGLDPKLKFIREQKEICIPCWDYKSIKSNNRRKFESGLNILSEMKDIKIENGVIAFCGRAYPYFRYEVYDGKKIPTQNITFFSYKSLLEYCEQKNTIFDKNLKQEIVETIKKQGYYKKLSCKEFDNIFVNSKLDDELFIKANSPIVHFTRIKSNYIVTINPLLKKYNFASQIDPFTAFQEISMFLGTVLVKQNDPSVNFSDDMKRDIAGFDKWSFRKKVR